MAVAAAEDREKSEKVEQEGDHRTEIVSGSGLRDQQLAHWPTFGEGQPIEALDEGIVHGLAGPAEVQPHPNLVRPAVRRARIEFGAIVPAE
jgi:hypothetical protein